MWRPGSGGGIILNPICFILRINDPEKFGKKTDLFIVNFFLLTDEIITLCKRIS